MVATSDVDFTLTDTQLTGLGTVTFANIELATLTGGIGDNVINGTGFTGGITMSGGNGNDTLTGGGGDDTIFGGLGDDSIDGGDGVDTVVESGDLDFILTDSQLVGLGTDSLINIEQATISGGVGNNTLDAAGFSGAATLAGDAGDDTLVVGTGNDVLDGGDGADTVVATGDVDFTLTDTQLTGLGTDTLANIEQATITGGVGDNILNAAGFTSAAMLLGDAGNDTLVVGTGNNTLDGGEGTDTLTATGDVDLILIDSQLTGLGTDTFANIEQVTLIGGPGDNRLDASGFSGTTVLSGDTGNDTLVVGNGDDTVDGGDGIDTLVATGDVDFALTDGQLTGLGIDTLVNVEEANITGGAGENVLDASGFSGIATLTGSAGNDTIIGGMGNDTLDGSEGDDVLIWNNSNDNDVVEGGPGVDTVQVNGSTDTVGDEFMVEANDSRISITRTIPTSATLDIGTTENLEINAGEGDDSITFNSTMDSFSSSLIVDGQSGRDSIIINGDITTEVDSEIRLINSTLILTGDSSLITENGDITLNEVGTNTNASHILTISTETGNVAVTGDVGVIDGNSLGGLTVESANDVSFPGEDKTVNVGGDITISSNTITLSEDHSMKTNTGDITLNAPVNAQGTLSIETNGGNIITANTPNVTSINIANPDSGELNGGSIKGNFLVNTNGGDITLGDVAVSNAVDIDAGGGTVILNRRGNRDIRVFNDQVNLSNRGATIAATNRVNITAGDIGFAGAGITPMIITRNGNRINQNIASGNSLPFGSPSAAASDVGRAIAGAVPKQNIDVPQEINIGMVEADKLSQLGIYTRELTDEEVIKLSAGRSTFYNSLPSRSSDLSAGEIGVDMKPGDYRIPAGRLPRDLASRVIDSYNAIFWRTSIDKLTSEPKVDDDGNPILESKADQVTEILQGAFDSYKTHASSQKFNPKAFREFVHNSPGLGEARKILDQLQDLFNQVKLLGLTPTEFKISKHVILRPLKLQEINRDQLEKILGIYKKKEVAMHRPAKLK